ncbi:class I adenylate-forming enzyme family protein [Novosphingobium sp. RD2P27]|uniref:Class I adenylate-forming enzyme family protein n=1 Tax=Novosphingobium kalidii TaxID=3230299 RepID=A0ABV2D3Y6_9SPHN
MVRSNKPVDGSYAFGIPLSEEKGIGPLTLGQYLRELAWAHSSREAVVQREGDLVERWTYAELWNHSIDVARALIASGVGKGTRVGILMTNRLEFLSALFGTALAGGVATTLNTFFTAPELGAVLETAGCSVLLMERRVLRKDFLAMLRDLDPAATEGSPGGIGSLRFPFLRHVVCIGEVDANGAAEGWNQFLRRGESIPAAHVDARDAAITPADPGVLFFSSGSTGKAKGILTAHRSVCLQLWRWKTWYGISEPPRTWSANAFFFSGNFAMALGGTLSSGGCLILQRTFEPSEALRLIEQERATMLLAWPHQWPQLETAAGYETSNLSALRYVDANSPVARHPSVCTKWREPRAYGSTETFTLITALPGGESSSGASAAGSHGVPTAGSAVRIVDPITRQVLPLGESGEIAVKGPTLMLGYLGIPLDEMLDDEGYFCTGDGGHLDVEGRLFWSGRLNDIIKTGGANVSPLEIDEVLRDCPGVKISQTIGVPDDLLGEMIVACIVPHERWALTQKDVQAHARQQLASFKVPREVLFFADDELATTGSAKIKTAHLRKLARARLASDGAIRPTWQASAPDASDDSTVKPNAPAGKQGRVGQVDASPTQAS